MSSGGTGEFRDPDPPRFKRMLCRLSYSTVVVPVGNAPTSLPFQSSANLPQLRNLDREGTLAATGLLPLPPASLRMVAMIADLQATWTGLPAHPHYCVSVHLVPGKGFG